jgi:hypothetical protein
MAKLQSVPPGHLLAGASGDDPSKRPKSEWRRSQDPTTIVTRIVVETIVIALMVVAVVDLVLPVTRNRSEHDDRSADGNDLEKCDGVLFGHSNASVGGGISWEIPGVQAETGRELHEIPHRRVDELGAGRCGHIDIGIRNHRPVLTVDDPPVDAGNVIQILVGDLKCSGRRQVTGPPGTNRRLHDGSIVVEEISLLLGEIELHGVLGQGAMRQARQ